MFQIQRLRLQIGSTNPQETTVRYGFDIAFNSGLNIIAAENSHGKSTINSAIYYALGMEELLGGQNEKALDKALKAEFDIEVPGQGPVTKHVFRSTIYIQLINSAGKVVTLKRTIRTVNGDQSNKTILVYESAMGDIAPETTQIALFLRNPNNHEDEFGYYRWFAEFMQLNLPKVPSFSKVDEESPLYLQTIFPALFIEQTKGWSEFLATCPYFGIPRNKEKSIAFILNLNELEVSAQRDKLAKEEDALKQKWREVCTRIDIVAQEYSVKPNHVPKEITLDTESLHQASLSIIDSTSTKTIDVQRKEFAERAAILREEPLKKAGDQNPQLKKQLEELYGEQDVFMRRFQKFDQQFVLEKSQLHNLKKHFADTVKEINSHQGISNIISQSILASDVYHKCPTCSQDVSDDLLLTEGVTIEKLTVDENLAYLKGQKKIIESAIKSLSLIIGEKVMMRKYYLRKQREFEQRIKFALQELIADDRDFSETRTFEIIRLESSASDLGLLSELFADMIAELKSISEDYNTLARKKEELARSFEDDARVLDEFAGTFKSDFLQPFGYTSNQMNHIFIQKTEPFKYFPVFKYNENDTVPQPIKNNSSASDFIRTLWAYYIALLVKGPNHPGLLLIDEPGQHSVKSSSLKTLFESCAQLKDRQVIIFTSVQKVLIQSDRGAVDTLDLDNILSGLTVDEDYKIYRIATDSKSIALMS